MASSVCQKIIRRKPEEHGSSEGSLGRFLTTFDLVLMGFGGIVGSGIYVMTGVAAKDLAGPSIVLSFIIAGIVVALCAACFTEFSARFHKAGLSYIYIYNCFGELPAFVVGWCYAICVICAGSVSATAWSAYLDNLINGTLASFTRTHIADWTVGPPIAQYPDFVASAVIIVLTIVVSLGARFSSLFNNIVVVLNVLVLLFVTVVGFLYADVDNWTSEATGGFMPYGWSGVLKGAGTCFFSLAGFDIIAAGAGEAKTPGRSIPIATGIVVAGVTALYVTMSAALTLMTSYQDVDTEAPLPSAFEVRGVTWARYVAAIGPIISLLSMTMNCIYGGARMVYAMAADGLLPPVFSSVSSRTQAPLITPLVVGFLMCLIALFLNLSDLLGFTVVIILGQYLVVAISVIILRYRDDNDANRSSSSGTRYGSVSPRVSSMDISANNDVKKNGSWSGDSANQAVHTSLEKQDHFQEISINVSKEDLSESLTRNLVVETTSLIAGSSGGLRLPFRFMARCFPSRASCSWVPLATFLYVLTVLLLAFALVYGSEQLAAGSWWFILIVCFLVLVSILLLGSIWIHRQGPRRSPFQVPLVPFIPGLTVFVGTFLLVSSATPISWLGVLIIIALSILIYFTYGMRHSTLNQQAGDNTDNVSPEETTGLLEHKD